MWCWCGTETAARTGLCEDHAKPGAPDRVTPDNPTGSDRTGEAVDTIWDYEREQT